MLGALSVGAGGFLGAVCRYLLGLIPWQGEFPLITFIINFTGAVIIGFVAEFMFQRAGDYNANLMLFLRTGFCGGYTTLSALGVETITLFQKGSYLLGGAYALGSLAATLVGVVIGQTLARLVFGANGVAA